MPETDLRLLALDGGSVRGLSSLMILRRLMAYCAGVGSRRPLKSCRVGSVWGRVRVGSGLGLRWACIL